MKKKIILTFLVFAAFFSLGVVLKVRADETQSARGWIWSGSEDKDISGNMGIIDGNESGLGLISVNNLNTSASASVKYGVDIPPSGEVKGYAWYASEDNLNYGWIDFNPADHCVADNSAEDSNLTDPGVCVPTTTGKYCAKNCDPPSSVACDMTGVTRTGNFLKGCARIVGIAQETVRDNAGGWLGWIKMNGKAQDGKEYAVKINDKGDGILPCTDANRSCAWNGENDNNPEVTENIANGLGRVDLSGVTIEKAKSLKICLNNCNNPSNTNVLEDTTITINKDDTRILRACYNQSDKCNDPDGDITAKWTSSTSAVSLSSSGTSVTAKGDIAGQESDIKVQYMFTGSILEETFKIKVNPTSCPISCGGEAESDRHCAGQMYPDLNCGQYVCKGTKPDCNAWQELAP